MELFLKLSKTKSITLRCETIPREQSRVHPHFFTVVKIKLLSKLRQKFGDGSCSVEFMGRKFYLPDYATFSSEVTDIFVSGRDYFKSDSEKPKIVDIGANVGIGTFYFKLLYPNSEIRNFEADPSTFSYLIRNTANMSGVTSENYAIGDGGEKVLYRLATSLSSTTIESIAGGRDGAGSESITVRGMKLSEILTEEIDLLKMDCEGSEFEIINEAKDKLRMVKRIFMEVHVFKGESIPSILKVIEDAGFNVYVIATAMTHKQVIQGDQSYRIEIDCIRK